MQLQLKSCLIRSFRPDDALPIQRYANNHAIWRNLRDIFPHPYRVADAEAFMALVSAQKPETTFAIASGTEAIGCIGLTLGTDVHRRTAELGYWLGEPFWRRGIMSEAIAAFTRYAFDTFDLLRIYAQPFAGHHASARVLENAGFVREAILRANVVKEGQVLDSLLYAQVRSDRAAAR
jgi:RimJ/RimL family protein N-acetyltransferase